MCASVKFCDSVLSCKSERMHVIDETIAWNVAMGRQATATASASTMSRCHPMKFAHLLLHVVGVAISGAALNMVTVSPGSEVWRSDSFQSTSTGKFDAISERSISI